MTARSSADDDAGRAGPIDVLRAGGIVALPTDTVYGIAVALETPGGIEALFAAKRRPPDKAIMLLLADAAQADELGQWPPSANALATAWPARAVHPRERSPASFRSRAHSGRDGQARAARRLVPQEYGGAGMDYICLGLASEELEYVDTSLRVIMSVHAGLNCLTLLAWGTEEQKQRYLVPQAQGTKIAGYALTEPGAGSDARAHPDDRRRRRAIATCERREDRGSRSPMSPTTSWSSPGPISRRRSSAIRRASAPSSSSAPSRDSRAGR